MIAEILLPVESGAAQGILPRLLAFVPTARGTPGNPQGPWPNQAQRTFLFWRYVSLSRRGHQLLSGLRLRRQNKIWGLAGESTVEPCLNRIRKRTCLDCVRTDVFTEFNCQVVWLRTTDVNWPQRELTNFRMHKFQIDLRISFIRWIVPQTWVIKPLH